MDADVREHTRPGRAARLLLDFPGPRRASAHNIGGDPRPALAIAALRLAQLTMRKTPRWLRPYFRAGLTLQGDWR
jgi:hypothetical protein